MRDTNSALLDLNDKVLIRDSSGKYVVAGATLATAALTVAALEQPSRADAATDVTAMVTSLGGIAAAALVVALVPMSIFFAFKIVRRVMT